MATTRKRKQPTYKPRDYESANAKDIFVSVYGSMLMSQAFMDLSKPQQVLLLFMRFQVFGTTIVGGKTPAYKFKADDLFQDNKYFFFSVKYWRDIYHLYTNQGQFYKDKQALIEHGFISEVSNGKSHRVQTVFCFISDWKTWTKKTK